MWFLSIQTSVGILEENDNFLKMYLSSKHKIILRNLIFLRFSEFNKQKLWALRSCHGLPPSKWGNLSFNGYDETSKWTKKDNQESWQDFEMKDNL